MQRYKAVMKAGLHNIVAARLAMVECGARSLYLADKEDAVFFETDSHFVLGDVKHVDGISHVEEVGE